MRPTRRSRSSRPTYCRLVASEAARRARRAPPRAPACHPTHRPRSGPPSRPPSPPRPPAAFPRPPLGTWPFGGQHVDDLGQERGQHREQLAGIDPGAARQLLDGLRPERLAELRPGRPAGSGRSRSTSRRPRRARRPGASPRSRRCRRPPGRPVPGHRAPRPRRASSGRAGHPGLGPRLVTILVRSSIAGPPVRVVDRRRWYAVSRSVAPRTVRADRAASSPRCAAA